MLLSKLGKPFPRFCNFLFAPYDVQQMDFTVVNVSHSNGMSHRGNGNRGKINWYENSVL